MRIRYSFRGCLLFLIFPKTCSLVDQGFYYRWLSRGNVVYDFPYPSDGDTVLRYAIAVWCTRNTFTWLPARSLVACLRAALPEPTHAHVVLVVKGDEGGSLT